MINIHLAKPVLLDRQVEEVAPKLGLELEVAYKIAGCASSVLTEDENGLEKGSILVKPKDAEGFTCILTGCDALIWLCEQKGIEIKPIADVIIPTDVFYKCNMGQWNDISWFTAAVSCRSNRFLRLMELGAPDIIMRNEYRILREDVQQLEANCIRGIGRTRQRRKNGTMRRSLNDIGYSLLDGWSKEMLAEFARWEAEFETRLTEAETADNDVEES